MGGYKVWPLIRNTMIQKLSVLYVCKVGSAEAAEETTWKVAFKEGRETEGSLV